MPQPQVSCELDLHLLGCLCGRLQHLAKSLGSGDCVSGVLSSDYLYKVFFCERDVVPLDDYIFAFRIVYLRTVKVSYDAVAFA